MSLNYTPLRHRMLRAIGQGKVSIKADDRVAAAVLMRTTQAQVTRAFNSIEDEFLIEKTLAPGGRLLVELNMVGHGLLSEWTSQHGEPTP